jgi:quercetin dioxygenase-like cupin family protein
MMNRSAHALLSMLRMKQPKQRRLALAGLMMLVLAAGVAFARGRPMGTGFHVVTLPTGAQVRDRIETRVLLETAHTKLASVLIPKGEVLAPHSAPNQVTLQALSGSGEVRMAGVSERIDGSRLIVLAPGVEHEVRAAADTNLVVLVHHILPGPGSRGPAR